MSIPYDKATQLISSINDNDWILEAYKEAHLEGFQQDLEEKVGFSLFTEFVPANYNTAITQFGYSQTSNFYKGPVRCERISGGKITITEEKIVLDNEYTDTVVYCEENVKRTRIGIPTLLQEADIDLTRLMKHELNKEAFTLAVGAASFTVPAVTDSATALAAIDAVIAEYGAYMEDVDIVAHVPHQLLPFFREILTTRITVMGDNALKTGMIGDILGVKIKTLSSNILDAADAGTVLFTIGQPVHFYYDESMYDLNTYEAPKSDPSTVYHTSNKVREIRVVGQFVVWENSKQYIAKAA